MNKLKRNSVIVLFLSFLISSCTYESESNPGIETDPDLGKTLKELVKEKPELIERNDTIPFNKFTFNNMVFFSSSSDSLILHSIDFNSTGAEKVLIRFSNGDLAIATFIKANRYESNSYIVNFKDNNTIEVIDYNTDKVIFQGNSRK